MRADVPLEDRAGQPATFAAAAQPSAARDRLRFASFISLSLSLSLSIFGSSQTGRIRFFRAYTSIACIGLDGG